MKIIKKLLIIFLILFSCIMFILGIGLFWVINELKDADKYKEKISESIKQASGFEVYAEKISLTPDFKPYLPVNIHHFILYSPDGEKLLKTKDIYFKIKLLPLLKKRIKIYEVSLNRPIFEFDTNLKTDCKIGQKPLTFRGFSIFYDIKSLSLKDYKLIITDGKQKYSLEGENIDLSGSDFKNSIKLLTKGALREEKEELMSYEAELEIPSEESVFNSNKKKFLKAKIKSQNISLSKLREVYVFLSKILNIKSPLEDYKVTGRGIFDVDIESDFKSLKSRGEITISKAELNHSSLPFKVSDINSKINLENNNIIIDNTNANINNNKISLNGRIDDKFSLDMDFEAHGMELKNILPLLKDKNTDDVKINSGTADIKAKLIGKSLSDYLVNGDIVLKKLNISDKMNNAKVITDNLLIKLKSTPKSLSADIFSEITNIILEKQNFKLLIKDINANFDNNNLILNSSKLGYGNCLLDFSGTVKNVKENNREADFLAQGEIKADELQKELGKYIKFPSASKGKLPVIIKIDSIGDETKISSQITSDKNNYLSLLVIKELLNKPSMLNLIVVIRGKDLRIENASLLNIENEKGIKNFKLTFDKAKKIATINGGLKFQDKIKAENLKIQIPDSMTFSTGLFDGAEVSLKGDVSLNGELTSPKLKGDIVLNKLNLLKHNIIVQNTVLNLLDEIVKINIPNLVIGDSNFNITAEALTEFKDNLIIKNANISAQKLNLTTLTKAFPDIQTSEIFPGFEVPITVQTGSGLINLFQYEDIILKDVTLDFALKNNLLSIKKINSKGFDGKIKGGADFNFLMQVLNLDIQGSALNTNKLIQTLSEEPTDLTGRTDLTAKLQIQGNTREQQLKALRGNVKFTTNDGQLGLLGQFERYLQAQNLLHLGLDRAKWEDLYKAVKTHNTSYFRRAEGEISFDNGFAFIEHFKTQGRIMSLLLLGKYNLLNDYAIINIFGKISDEIFKQEPEASIYLNDEIPDVLSPLSKYPRGFRVNITGPVDNIRSINSFEWLRTDEEIIPSPEINIEVKSETAPTQKTYDKYPSFLNEI